ncbi:MAG: shikimate kinase [Thaumarchaeota archaeon]|nr:shikimate kinase [Nitrososphaerota archaeon]
MIGRASSFGAISIVNAIAGGKGATASIRLKTYAKVELNEGRGMWNATVNGDETAYDLPAQAVKQTLIASHLDPGKYWGTIETRSSIPMGVGLKSSSSTSVAVSLAVFDALGKDDINVEMVLGCSVRASLKSKVTITGALDDAASCLLGGVNMTDNLRIKLIRSRPLRRRLKVLIRVPPEKSRRESIDLGDAKKLSRICDALFRMSLGGSYWAAMTLNGILYSTLLGYPPGPAMHAIELGAIGAGLSGTGPAVAAVFDPADNKVVEGLRRDWSSDGSIVLETTTNNQRGGFLA